MRNRQGARLHRNGQGITLNKNEWVRCQPNKDRKSASLHRNRQLHYGEGKIGNSHQGETKEVGNSPDRKGKQLGNSPQHNSEPYHEKTLKSGSYPTHKVLEILGGEEEA